MDCKVQDVRKNIRYKILTINGEDYLLDIRPTLLKVLFPFLFWRFPFKIFHIDDALLEELKLKKKKQKASVNTVLFVGGTAVFISKYFLDSLVEFLELHTSVMLNVIIVVLAILIVFSFRFYLSHLYRKDIYKIVNLELLPSYHVRVKPKLIKNYIKVAYIYLLFLVLSIVGFMLYIGWGGNVFILIVACTLLFIVLLISKVIIEEEAKVKFKDKL